jgi:hypothetical protein
MMERRVPFCGADFGALGRDSNRYVEAGFAAELATTQFDHETNACSWRIFTG